MPLAQRLCETLFRASLQLLFIVIPFTTMAIPVITQELSKSSSSAPGASTATANGTNSTTLSTSTKLVNEEVVDIVIPFFIFLLFFWCLSLVGGFSFPPFVVIGWIAANLRPMLYNRLGARFGWAAPDVVGPDNARAAPQLQADDTAPTPGPTPSHRTPQEDAELDTLSSAPRCASSASDDGAQTSPSTA